VQIELVQEAHHTITESV